MSSEHSKTDVILIGGGIMRRNTRYIIKRIISRQKIKIFEKLEQSGEESSNVWNNLWHRAFCTL